MRWQQKARLAIALFLVVFTGIVFLAMRRSAVVPPAGPVKSVDPEAVVENTDGGHWEHVENDKIVWTLDFKRQLTYADGRTAMGGVTLVLPDRNGRTLTVTAERGQRAAGSTSDKIGAVELSGNVTLVSDDGITVRAGQATYDDGASLMNVPGPVEFSRGRMKGSGVGATYDQKLDVLWLQQQAHITVAPDDTGGGAVEATSGAAGLARAENYLRLTRNARIVADERTLEADDMTALLAEGGQTLRQLQLRGQSRITGSGAGAQAMTARDIDLGYAEDGRTLQTARLMQRAVVELPGGQRIAGETIDITMGADGDALERLTAVENVQMDLPSEASAPQRRIRAHTMNATGASGGELRNVVFERDVEFEETQPASGSANAVARTARSLRLIVDTKAGGTVERADFRGHVRFIDGSTTAEAPRAVYRPEADRLELSPSPGDPGPPPSVRDDQLAVDAQRIELAPGSGQLIAQKGVTSVIHPRTEAGPASKETSGKGPSSTRLPSMLQSDRPVTVVADRMEYDGTAVATYTGGARLWQDASRIDGDTIVLDDSSGNLTARGKVRTVMPLDDVDPKTKERRTVNTVGQADTFVYEDGRRVAVYTSTGDTRARLTGAQGDVRGNRIDLFLREGGSELERAEAHGRVTVEEGGRLARGAKLVYTAATDTYVMTGPTVEAIEKQTDGSCAKTTASTLTFNRSVDSIRFSGSGLTLVNTEKPIPCPAERHD